MKISTAISALVVFGLLVCLVELLDQVNCYADDGLAAQEFIESGRCE